MLEKATNLCDVAYGHIYTFDGEFFHPAAARADEGVEPFQRIEPYRPGPGSPTERLVNGEPFVHIADYQSDEVHPSSPKVREAIRTSGIRTGLLLGPGLNNPLWQLARGAPLAHVADMRELASLSEPGDQNLLLRAVVEQGGIRTMLMVPLRKDGALLGVISAYRQEVKPFTEKQI